MKSQMKAADRSGAEVAVIVGPDELAAGVVTLRALRADEQQADRRQEAVPRTGLVDAVRAWLPS